MLDQSYKDKSIGELLSILHIAEDPKTASGSVQDLKDLIIEKFKLESQSFQDYVQSDGGWGFIGDGTAQLRFLLRERDMYIPEMKS